MSMKMKKGEKSATPKIMKGRKAVVKSASQVPGSSRPVLSGIGRSLGTLLDRTKAKILSVGKAEA
jgi:hypothetical protein